MHDTAMLLSSALAAEGIAHTVGVGYHDHYHPPVQCSVNVRMPRLYSGGISAAIQRMEEIGDQFGVELCTDFMGEQLVFKSRPVQVPLGQAVAR